MAWEWVGPAATAATAVAGFQYAWLTSRASQRAEASRLVSTRKHEFERSLHDDKKEAYRKYLGLYDRFSRELFTARRGVKAAIAKSPDNWKNEPLPEVAELMTAYRDLTAHHFEVLLVSSDSLRSALDSSYKEATTAFEEVIFGKDRMGIPAEHFANLVEAMKGDLGYPR